MGRLRGLHLEHSTALQNGRTCLLMPFHTLGEHAIPVSSGFRLRVFRHKSVIRCMYYPASTYASTHTHNGAENFIEFRMCRQPYAYVRVSASTGSGSERQHIYMHILWLVPPSSPLTLLWYRGEKKECALFGRLAAMRWGMVGALARLRFGTRAVSKDMHMLDCFCIRG